MSRRIVFLCIHAAILISAIVSSQECIKSKVNNCQECIQSGPECAWCQQRNFTNAGEPDSTRCDTVSVLRQRGCKDGDIINPTSISSSINNPVLDIDNQLTPRGISLQLRPGKPASFDIKFRRAEGYPVDLYYLMDLSYSMEDDLQNVKKLGSELLKALNNITKSAQIGFGSFVDKTVLPFVNTHPEKLKRPCPTKNVNCQPPFSFKHILKLTADGNEFQKQVGQQEISGNLDSPEGGLDAMMQVAVCGDKIGWRNVTRLLVYATDDGFHIAGDGKLAAILRPNDGQCHLEGNLYKRSNEFDYPSVAHLAQKLADNNVQVVFAVTSNMVKTYQGLSKLIPKSVVGELSGNSSNVVQLITEAYQNLSSEVILDHGTTPDFLDIVYDSFCSDGQNKQDQTVGKCSNVKINEEINFTVKVTASRCLPDQSFVIRPLGFTDMLTVSVRTLCDCRCADTSQPGDCNSSGKITCGICQCEKDFVGKNCDCKLQGKTSLDLKQNCRNGNGSVICSGAGDCICGQCVCHINEDPTKVIDGPFCECDNWSCELFNNTLCGGQGTCKCGKCICNKDFEGDGCQCKKSNSGCLNERKSLCSGRGTCECSTCKCKPGYLVPFCEYCPGCTPPCDKFGPCIECLITNDEKDSRICSDLCPGVTAVKVERLYEETGCKQKDSNNCLMNYVIKEKDGEEEYNIRYIQKPECPEAPNVIAIVGGTIAGVILSGIIALLIWKGVMEAIDRKEYKRFEEERMKSKGKEVNNPLFQDATTTVANPMFNE
ncbi:integrin beta-2 [Bombina bombina]|uniref:integrin beta-2 n=1 Tax=Bombina bombina TaxID=8345 RepID=UPI00235A4A79|nr:integrin beta-2 [Bombina bombina]XP_053554743.1 integrin beta-2 [Bombina bombina]XP_053554744.1 integrin beta-2 [Bombina bombina]